VDAQVPEGAGDTSITADLTDPKDGSMSMVILFADESTDSEANGHKERLKAQLKSFFCMDERILRNTHYICPTDCSDTIRRLAEEVGLWGYRGFNPTFHTDAGVLGDINIPGHYYRQMAIKLYISQLITTDFYLILDMDVVAMTYVSLDELVRDGRVSCDVALIVVDHSGTNAARLLLLHAGDLRKHVSGWIF
jgi:hypothetical protein